MLDRGEEERECLELLLLLKVLKICVERACIAVKYTDISCSISVYEDCCRVCAGPGYGRWRCGTSPPRKPRVSHLVCTNDALSRERVALLHMWMRAAACFAILLQLVSLDPPPRRCGHRVMNADLNFVYVSPRAWAGWEDDDAEPEPEPASGGRRSELQGDVLGDVPGGEDGLPTPALDSCPPLHHETAPHPALPAGCVPAPGARPLAAGRDSLLGCGTRSANVNSALNAGTTTGARPLAAGRDRRCEDDASADAAAGGGDIRVVCAEQTRLALPPPPCAAARPAGPAESGGGGGGGGGGRVAAMGNGLRRLASGLAALVGSLRVSRLARQS